MQSYIFKWECVSVTYLTPYLINAEEICDQSLQFFVISKLRWKKCFNRKKQLNWWDFVIFLKEFVSFYLSLFLQR